MLYGGGGNASQQGTVQGYSLHFRLAKPPAFSPVENHQAIALVSLLLTAMRYGCQPCSRRLSELPSVFMVHGRVRTSR